MPMMISVAGLTGDPVGGEVGDPVGGPVLSYQMVVLLHPCSQIEHYLQIIESARTRG